MPTSLGTHPCVSHDLAHLGTDWSPLPLDQICDPAVTKSTKKCVRDVTGQEVKKKKLISLYLFCFVFRPLDNHTVFTAVSTVH